MDSSRTDVIQGNSACIEGAILAGCRHFACYPITPSNEIAEEAALKLPLHGGRFIQMEDELGAIMTLIGASWGGSKAMTATSGPGLCLMQEGIGWAALSETPLVIVDVQRGGPASGQSTSPAQGDVFAIRYGSNGDYPMITLAPSNAQEFLEMTVQAFNLSERFRTPVIIAADEIVSHTREKVTIPAPGSVKVVERKKTTENPGEGYLPFKPDENGVPPMANFFEGYNVPVLSQVHGYDGFRAKGQKEASEFIRRLHSKIDDHMDEITSIDEYMTEDAQVVFVSYGSVTRAARSAVTMLREDGYKVGSIQLKTIWPFPEKEIREYGKRFKTIIVPEMNMGKMVKEVHLAADGECTTLSFPKVGGACHTPNELCNFFKEATR